MDFPLGAGVSFGLQSVAEGADRALLAAKEMLCFLSSLIIVVSYCFFSLILLSKKCCSGEYLVFIMSDRIPTHGKNNTARRPRDARNVDWFGDGSWCTASWYSKC